MQDTKKIYLACNPDKVAGFMEKNKESKNKRNYVEDIKEADCLMIVDGTDNYDSYIEKAKGLGINDIVYLNENGCNKSIYEALLSNNKQVTVKM